MIRALIFDFDGLILETEGPIYQSWRWVYASFGLDLPPDTWAHVIGTWEDLFNPVTDLERQLNRRLDWEELETRRSALESELIEAQPIQPGVMAYLHDAHRLGLKIGLASSSQRGWVYPNLERLGIVREFECILTREDVQNTKPDPEVYLAAVARLGVQPQEAIALEDSQHGVQAARRAGLYAVAVPIALTRHLPYTEASLRLDSLADLPLERVVAMAGGA